MFVHADDVENFRLIYPGVELTPPAEGRQWWTVPCFLDVVDCTVGETFIGPMAPIVSGTWEHPYP